MNSWQNKAFENLQALGFPVFRWFVTGLLVLSLASCGEKAVSQDVSISYQENPQLVAKQFSEVSPPATIEDLESVLDVYQPQVSIITPKPDEILQDNKVTVRLQVKDLPIFKDPELKLGPHLEVILDNQTHKSIYDLNQPLILPDLSAGTHTLRVFASRPWNESFKNEGAFAQTTFHIFAKSEDNNPDPVLPLLTYNSPRGEYGSEPILLDFYLTNAPLHLLSANNADDKISDWRIRCTINGESFVVDRWESVYLKGFQPGQNWVKLEFLDNQGNALKNAFNTTVEVITYQPNGKDTLSRIVRGELKADQVRGIVDPNYTAKIPPTAPTPEPSATPEAEKTPKPEIKPEKQPIPEAEAKEEPKTEPTAPKQPEEPKLEQPTAEKQPIPETEAKEEPKTEPTAPKQPEEPKLEQPTVVPSKKVSPTVEPTVEPIAPSPTPTAEPQPEVTPTPEATQETEKEVPQAQTKKLSEDVQSSPLPTSEASPEASPNVSPTPEVKQTPAPEVITPSPSPTAEAQPGVKLEAEAIELPNV